MIYNGYDAPFYFNDMDIKYNNKHVHLGHNIGPCIHQDIIKNVCHDFTWRLNSLVCNFGFCNIRKKRQLNYHIAHRFMVYMFVEFTG